MRNPPPEVWESFPRSDPAHPVRSGPALIIVNAVFMILITIVVALRLFARVNLKRRLGYDDYCISLALVNSPMKKSTKRHTDLYSSSRSHLVPIA